MSTNSPQSTLALSRVRNPASGESTHDIIERATLVIPALRKARKAIDLPALFAGHRPGAAGEIPN